ncbi:VOC family protein [Streptomyces sp. NPDC006798]|uniref:VOC family protein n=1 Tax=Streptomyces sp. NPDC006798 TaxID=3155462 RepID=UPI003405287D
MTRMIYVHLPVKDLSVSTAFFEKLGFALNPEFSGDDVACVDFGEAVHAMLLTEPFYRTFTDREIADARQVSETLLCLTADSREEVDRLVDTAIASGGSAAGQVKDQGPVYSRGFADPDGHHWEIMFMDVAALAQG